MASTVTTVPARLTALPSAAVKVTLAGAIRSEFTKIRSVRSTYWTLFALIVVTVGIGALSSWGAASHWSQMSPGDRATFDPTQQSLIGLILGQLIIAVLGALTMTSEFSTGMVRTSLSAQPRRGLLIAAKGIVFAVVAFVTGLVASFGAFFLGQALMSGKHIDATLGQPHVLSAVIGGALFLTVCGMLAFGLGLLIRHTAGAITAAVGLLFVLFIMVNFLPQSWQNDLDRWLPFNAGSGVWRDQFSPDASHLFAPWTGFAVFVGYAAIAIAAGMITFRRRNV
jgi:ABC-2 type transport system permease protein